MFVEPTRVTTSYFAEIRDFPPLSSEEERRLISLAQDGDISARDVIVQSQLKFVVAVAKPLVVTLIGEKWLPCVPYLQLLAIGWVVDPIINVNLNVLYVKGQSNVVLKLEVIKKIIAISIVVVSVQFGIIWLCVGRVAYGYIALFLNLYFCAPYIGMGVMRQICEVSGIYCASAIAALCAFVASDVLWECSGLNPHGFTILRF